MNGTTFYYIRLRERGSCKYAAFGGTRHKGHPAVQFTLDIKRAEPWSKQDKDIILRRWPGTEVFHIVDIAEDEPAQSADER